MRANIATVRIFFSIWILNFFKSGPFSRKFSFVSLVTDPASWLRSARLFVLFIEYLPDSLRLIPTDICWREKFNRVERCEILSSRRRTNRRSKHKCLVRGRRTKTLSASWVKSELFSHDFVTLVDKALQEMNLSRSWINVKWRERFINEKTKDESRISDRSKHFYVTIRYARDARNLARRRMFV